jgi:hypothetical protein
MERDRDVGSTSEVKDSLVSSAPVGTAEKAYVIETLDIHSGSIVVSEVGNPSNIAVITKGVLHLEGEELSARKLAPMFGGSLAREEIFLITGGKTHFSVEDLMVLHQLISIGVSYARSVSLVLSEGTQEAAKKRFESHMETILPSMQNLLALVNSKLPAEELVDILMRRL